MKIPYQDIRYTYFAEKRSKLIDVRYGIAESLPNLMRFSKKSLESESTEIFFDLMHFSKGLLVSGELPANYGKFLLHVVIK